MTDKRNLSTLLLAISLASLTSMAVPAGAQRVPAQGVQRPHGPAEEYSQELVVSPVPRSRPSVDVQKGTSGDATPYSWMDKMREEGVKRALVRTEFVWRGKPIPVGVLDVLYFKRYDYECSQISDPKRLEEIRASGLERVLREVAMERTKAGHWYSGLDHVRVRHTKRGTCSVELVDDERVRVPPPFLYPPSKNPDQLLGAIYWGHEARKKRISPGFADLLGAILRGDEASVGRLLRGGIGPQELSAAMQAVTETGDPCTARLLLNAGADVNALNPDGYTPLMDAAGNGKAALVKVLLEAHADVNASDRWGRTPLSLAARNGYVDIVEILRAAGARE